MADEFDQATDREEKDREMLLNIARAKAQQPILPSEVCLYCGEDTQNGARWCDADCRDLWEQRRV